MKENNSKRIDKDKMLTINEFSEIVGIPDTKLRYYDEKGIFKPAKYGKGAKNKYRYYSPTQITEIKMVRVLSELGASHDTFLEMNEFRSPETTIKMLTKSKSTISYEIEYLKEVLDIVEIYRDNIMEGIIADEDLIAVFEKPKKTITLGDKTNFYEDDSFYNNYLDFCAKPRNPMLNLSYPVGGYFDSMEAFLSHPSEPSHFFSLDPNGKHLKEKGYYLIGYTRGYYGQVNDLPEKMKDYANEFNIEFDGPVYNMYLFDEISTSDSGKYLLQVSASIKYTRHEFSRNPYHHYQGKKGERS